MSFSQLCSVAKHDFFNKKSQTFTSLFKGDNGDADFEQTLMSKWFTPNTTDDGDEGRPRKKAKTTLSD